MTTTTLRPETSELELVETAEPAEDDSDLLHIYCGVCLHLAYPGRVLPLCGTKRPRSDGECTYPTVDLAPPQDICVVCRELHYGAGCERCGNR